MRKDGNSAFATVCFVLFILWGIGTLLAVFLPTNIANVIDNIIRIVAFVVLAYSAYTYYLAHKRSSAVTILFCISAVVGLVAVVLPFFF
ncbi:MAG: hypothetical protein RR086_05830 [Clostridia bacterium]